MLKQNGSRIALTPAELREAIQAELTTIGFTDVADPSSIALEGRGSRWHATLRPNGVRFEKSKCAAIAAIAEQLAAGFDLQGE